MPIAFEIAIAERISRNHSELAARWFARLLDLLPVDARDIFPTDALLDHIPSLIAEIGTYVGDPERHAIAANTLLLDKARELGTLRHRQQASLHQLLREYQLLGEVLTTFVKEEIEALHLAPTPAALADVTLHLQRAAPCAPSSVKARRLRSPCRRLPTSRSLPRAARPPLTPPRIARLRHDRHHRVVSAMAHRGAYVPGERRQRRLPSRQDDTLVYRSRLERATISHL